jgi:hypothetical protein
MQFTRFFNGLLRIRGFPTEYPTFLLGQDSGYASTNKLIVIGE